MSQRYLAAIGLLVVACNHEFPPPPSQGNGGGTSGPAGIAGGAGTDGTSRPSDNGVCPGGSVSDYCIDSCSSVAQAHAESAYCDARGTVVCADGKVKLSSCAPDSCAQIVWTCCNEASGLSAYPPCTADGRQQPCPAGSHTLDNVANCIPTSLDVTDCGVLAGTACSSPPGPQRCTSHTPTAETVCSCAPSNTSATAAAWQCQTFSSLI